MNQAEFIQEVYGRKDEKAWIHLWEKNTKESYFTTDINKATEYLQKNNRDVYIAPGFRRENFGKSRRGKFPDITGIVALYIDIDISGPGHPSKNLPATQGDAITLIKNRGLEPTIIIFTGHGIQAWWLFENHWMFANDTDRLEAKFLNGRLHNWVSDAASEKTWKVDNTSDLTRVYRPPGTINCKNSQEIPTEVIHSNGIRYTIDNFKSFFNVPVILKQEQAKKTQSVISDSEIKKTIKKIVFDKNARSDEKKMVAMYDIWAPDFLQTYNNNRPDLEDQSPSGYDFSLAVMAAKTGWSDQEIVDLLINFRRLHGFNLKFDNQQYYARTVLNAQEKAIEEKVDKILLATQQRIGSNFEKPDDKKKQQETLSLQLGFKIIEVHRYVGSKTKYGIILEMDNKRRKAMFSSIAKLSKLTSFMNIISDTIKRRPKIKWVKGKSREDQFENIIDEILQISIDVKIEKEAFFKWRLVECLEEYFERHDPLIAAETYPSHKPFVQKREWHININHFREWVRSTTGEDVARDEITIEFKDLKYSHRIVNITLEDKTRRQKKVWILPKLYFDPDKI